MRVVEPEPELGPWRVQPTRAVAEDLVVRCGAHRAESGRDGPLVVAVDGRSASGKSTVATLLTAQVPDSVVVHTDDIAWHHSFFGWDELLVTGVLEPAARGEAVAYRPPGWVQQEREGAVVVPAGTQVLVVEGVGTSRVSLRAHLDAAVWVQSDADAAYRRGLDRDVSLGRERSDAEAFWAEWEAEEVPLLTADRPWERADVVVCGTPLATGVYAPPGAVLVGEPATRPA